MFSQPIPQTIDGNTLFHRGFHCYTKIPPDYKMAKYYYKKAEMAGNIYALINLGTMNFYGTGVPQNTQKALAYYEKAYAKSPKEAIVLYNLGMAHQFGAPVIPRDFSKALNYYEAAAINGFAKEAFRRIGVIYSLGGFGVTRDYDRAFYYFMKGAKLDDPQSLYFVGYYYSIGRSVSQDSKEALHYYQKSADLGDKNALYSLGERYETGRDVEKNIQKAIEHYHQSSIPEAFLKLGNLYNLQNDFDNAILYYRKAADHSLPEAISWFNRMFYITSISKKPTYLQDKICYHAAMVSSDKDILAVFEKNFLENPEIFIPFLENNLLDTVDKLKKLFPETFDKIFHLIQLSYFPRFFMMISFLPCDLSKIVLQYCIQDYLILPVLQFSPSTSKVNPFKLFHHTQRENVSLKPNLTSRLLTI